MDEEKEPRKKARRASVRIGERSKRSKRVERVTGSNITYDVLRMILRNLNGRDLASAAMVSRSWLEAAKSEKNTRLKPEWFLVHFNRSRSQKLIISGRRLADNLFIEPRVALFFAGISSQYSYRQKDNEAANDCHCSYLPLHCDSLALWNYGVIAEKTELEDDNTAVSCLFLPKIPGVKIQTFSYAKNELPCPLISKRLEVAQNLCKISDNEENLKCVILFSDADSGFSCAKNILECLVLKRPNDVQEKIAIWGGICENLTMCERIANTKMCTKMASVAGISICGAGVSTWSLVLDRNVKTKEQVEKKLITLRDSVKLQKYTVGFMFACCGRGEKMFRGKNIESTAFKTIFQNVPLVGSFGGGEFGRTTISDESPKSRLSHEFSTVFLILTYG